MNLEHLVFVNPIGINAEGMYEYDLLFSEKPDEVWGNNWEVSCPSICGNLLPDSSTYDKTIRIVSCFDFFCAQNNNCFSMQDCVDGCIALMWFRNYDYDTVIFNYGEEIDIVKDKLNKNGITNITQ